MKAVFIIVLNIYINVQFSWRVKSIAIAKNANGTRRSMKTKWASHPVQAIISKTKPS